MKVSITACDLHGSKEVRAATDIVDTRGLLTHTKVRKALCAECAERYWAAVRGALEFGPTNGNGAGRSRRPAGEGFWIVLRALATFDEPPRGGELAKAAGMTPGAFHRHTTNLGGMRYVKRLGTRNTATWLITTRGRTALLKHDKGE